MKKPTALLAAFSCAALMSLGAASVAHADTPANGSGNTIKNLNSGLCAAVGDNSKSNGAGLIQYKCDTKANKQFTSTWAGTDSYFFKVTSSGKCIQPQGTAEHALVVQQTCSNSDLQVWTAVFLGNDSYQLRNRASGLCLGAGWGATNSGQPLDQAVCGAFPGQSWRFTAQSG
ncbi:RICIN domain-containing protein [Kitasatospora sp. NPDC048540]|uniref:RICIN domain-containing protein n=1 Tax=unclassified Kitasatospora TaxID=2633591 RepID=UPI00053B00C8|nr:RICIN domain-containing protein [Kitasatospora sp. MBT63]